MDVGGGQVGCGRTDDFTLAVVKHACVHSQCARANMSLGVGKFSAGDGRLGVAGNIALRIG